jgi:phosphohistidine swiveling domain-containing protein
MLGRCLDLTDQAALDPAHAGAKAAGLSAAHAAGLPVLPGVIVPVAEAWPVVEAVTRALASGNDAQARLAALEIEPDRALLAELDERLASLPEPLIVRSSSPLEGDGTWSGAFSSFHGIRRDEVWTALRGCWGAAFSVGVLNRARHTGTDPAQLGLAVLIQPELRPDIGGIARLRGDGSVRITATKGPLVPLMAGDVEGEVTVVGADDEVLLGQDDNTSLHREVAALSRRVAGELGHGTIEWLAVDGSVHLLQSLGSPAPPTEGLKRRPPDPAYSSEIARRLASLSVRYSGALAEALVLPWAVAVDVPRQSLEVDRQVGRDEAIAAFAAARAAASSLTAQLWGGSPRTAALSAERVLRQLRGDEPGAAIATLEQIACPSPAAVARVMDNLALVAAHLVGERLVDSHATFWRLSTEALGSILFDGLASPQQRLGVERWEPFLYSVVDAVGQRVSGTPAAPGAGAGRAFVFEGAASLTALPAGRYVIVASQPSPALSPLLWNAAGLVTRSGSTAAHLIEFAHSIGVPTVVGCDLPPLSAAPEAPLLAVNGDSGQVCYAWLD